MRFNVLDVALFNVTHQLASVGNVTLHSSGDLDRHHRYLIVRCLAPGNRAASGNQVRAPLEDEAKIPENQQDCGSLGGQPGVAFVPGAREIVDEACEAENEKNGEGDEEAVAEGREAVPILITADHIEKCGESNDRKKAENFVALAQQPHSDYGGEGDGRPAEEAVIGGEENFEEGGRIEEPTLAVAKIEITAINYFLGDEGGQKGSDEGKRKRRVLQEFPAERFQIAPRQFLPI